MRFAITSYSSNYYIFDSHSLDVSQATEKGYSMLLKFLTTEHVLNFITTIYLVNNQLQHVYENQFIFFPEVKISIKKRNLKSPDRIIGILSFQLYEQSQYVNKKAEIIEDNCDQNCVNFMPTGKTEY